MGKDTVLALGKGTPSLGRHTVLSHGGQGIHLLEEGVQLHLVHHWLDLHRLTEVGEHMGIEIAHADGLDLLQQRLGVRQGR